MWLLDFDVKRTERNAHVHTEEEVSKISKDGTNVLQYAGSRQFTTCRYDGIMLPKKYIEGGGKTGCCQLVVYNLVCVSYLHCNNIINNSDVYINVNATVVSIQVTFIKTTCTLFKSLLIFANAIDVLPFICQGLLARYTIYPDFETVYKYLLSGKGAYIASSNNLIYIISLYSKNGNPTLRMMKVGNITVMCPLFIGFPTKHLWRPLRRFV